MSIVYIYIYKNKVNHFSFDDKKGTIEKSKHYSNIFESWFMHFQKFTLKTFQKRKYFKVGLSPSKKICFICFNERPLKL